MDHFPPLVYCIYRCNFETVLHLWSKSNILVFYNALFYLIFNNLLCLNV